MPPAFNFSVSNFENVVILSKKSVLAAFAGPWHLSP